MKFFRYYTASSIQEVDDSKISSPVDYWTCGLPTLAYLTGIVVTPASIVRRLANASSVSPGFKNMLTSATTKYAPNVGIVLKPRAWSRVSSRRRLSSKAGPKELRI